MAIGLTLAACAPSSTQTGDPTVKMAFFQDLSMSDSLDLVSPSFLAFDTVVRRELAPTGIGFELVEFDTAGDPEAAAEMARAVAADPDFVLAVIAPFWSEPLEVSSILAEAGVPTLSLSPESASPWSSTTPPEGDAAELWRRFVPDRIAETELLGETAAAASGESSQPVCLVTDGSGHASAMASAVDTALAHATLVIEGTDPLGAAATVGSADCALVVHTGFPQAARDFHAAMRGSDPSTGRTIDLAGAALKTIVPLLSDGGSAPVVRAVACACADVSLATDLASRTFVNAYQSEHGLAPGVYAVEAWDAGTVVAEALRSGVSTRADMRERLRPITSVEGLAETYIFDVDGERVDARAAMYTAAGTRWIPGAA